MSGEGSSGASNVSSLIGCRANWPNTPAAAAAAAITTTSAAADGIYTTAASDAVTRTSTANAIRASRIAIPTGAT